MSFAQRSDGPREETFEASSEEEMRALGEHLATCLPAHGVVLLIGDLGAGKTTLTKGIVAGRGAATAEEVSSPTYTLIHEYGEPVAIYHIDLYRLESAEEARRLGLEEIFEQPALVLMEWGDRFPELIPPRYVEIRILDLADGEGRRVTVLSGNS
jgi:tRNA threonylcarbamoyladenosine biosynthesis protein TsaE